MRPKSKHNEMGEVHRHPYSCFICDEGEQGKGLRLLKSQTAFSRITLGEKLQEILGNNYVVLLSGKDRVCWDCASSINWVDRTEHKLNLVKDYILDKVIHKYKRKEIALGEIPDSPEQVDTQQGAVEVMETPPTPLPAIKKESFQIFSEKLEEGKRPRKKKDYMCKYCEKKYATLVTLTMHIQKFHSARFGCSLCDQRFQTQAKLKKHEKMHTYGPADKNLTCVSCGFQTTNTEVYCRHVCNSNVVSLSCISCKKRYLDTNFRQDTGSYKCKICTTKEEMAREEAAVAAGPAEIVVSSHITEEMPEFLRMGDMKGEAEVGYEEREGEEEEDCSFLRCEGCGEQFLLSDLTKHGCFLRGDAVEYVEVESPTFLVGPGPASSARKRPLPEVTYLQCKGCDAQFRLIEHLRSHWDQTGHIREVNTPSEEVNKIKDKLKKTEATFKVVKQNFNIRATIPGKNEEVLRSGEDYKDIFVRVNRQQDTIEEFEKKKDGKECETCGIVFSNEELLLQHQKLDCLTCVTCAVTFLDNKLLKRHYQYTGHASVVNRQLYEETAAPGVVYHQQQPELQPQQQAHGKLPLPPSSPLGFNCHRCTKVFPSRFLLRKHFNSHFKGTTKGACQYCLREFDTKEDVQSHILRDHGAHTYECNFCNRTFMSENFKRKHEAKHRPPLRCDTCDVKFNSEKSLVLHYERKHESGGTCRLCDKQVQDPVSLRRHERRHYFERGLECDLCQKKFKNKALLVAHSKVHVGEVKFQCEICHLGFASEDSLKEHKASHLGRSKYRCPKCHLLCSNYASYWMHAKMHEASYACTVCKRKFRDTSLLAVHRRKHLRSRPYQCPRCPRSFSVPSTLRRHMYLHSKVFPFTCQLCSRGFLTQPAYRKHVQFKHGTDGGQSRRASLLPHIRPTAASNSHHLPPNASDEDILHAADDLIDNSIMFNDYQNKDIDHVSNDLISNEVVVETTELFEEILH